MNVLRFGIPAGKASLGNSLRGISTIVKSFSFLIALIAPDSRKLVPVFLISRYSIPLGTFSLNSDPIVGIATSVNLRCLKDCAPLKYAQGLLPSRVQDSITTSSSFGQVAKLFWSFSIRTSKKRREFTSLTESGKTGNVKDSKTSSHF